MFLSIKKVIIGIITVRMKIGNRLPLCNSSGLYFGVIKKYAKVPAIGMKSG
jgi:hypothetical protein